MKELHEYKNIWVYLESKNGALSKVGLELLTPAVCWPTPPTRSWWAS